MMEDERYIIETEEIKTEPTSRWRLPVLAQLGIIVLIIGGLFAGLMPDVNGLFNDEENQTNQEIFIVDKKLEPKNSIQKIDPSTVSLVADSAFVWDIKEQRVLYEKESNEVMPLASITKLMTALLAYELVTDNTEIIVGETASRQESGGNLREGEIFAVKSLADFALVSSYNSAAYAIADSVGAMLGDEDSVEQFVAGMNIKAEELNLNNLEFINPTGLDISETKAGAYGTAKEVSFLVEYILLNYPEILKPTTATNFKIYNKAGEYHEADNTNDIITDIPNLLGSKTGYTDLAGGNLTVVVDVGFDHPVVITVLGSTLQDRFTDVETLIKSIQASIVLSEKS
ncbi:MAG: serine hydrolase [Candidatus Paceibacterota bacterium]